MSHSKSTYRSANLVRWFGRISGVLLVAFVGLLVIGHGGPPNVLAQPVTVQLESLGMSMIILGVLLAWWRDMVGGIVSIAGFLLFCAVEIAVNGSMPGGVIPLFCIPGVFLILGGLVRRPGGRTSHA